MYLRFKLKILIKIIIILYLLSSYYLELINLKNKDNKFQII